MATATNPLTGSGWSPNQQNNPFVWAGTNINQPPTPPTSALPPTSPFNIPTPNLNPGNLANPTSNIKDITRNTGLVNLATGQLRNDLIPQFAQLMGKYGMSAGDFFKMLMDKGSPFYQQKQREGFEQGVQQNQNAAGQARQQLSSAGYGATPSGANVAAIAGMNQAGAKSLAEQYLENLFQNENLMVQGAQGETQVASMFNPSSLFGNVSTPGSTQGPAAAEQAAAVLGSIFGSGGFNRKNFSGAGG